jgi:hypothetical protein
MSRTEPAAALQVPVQAAGRDGDQDQTEDEAGEPLVPGVGHVLPEEPGERGGHRDDRGPRGQLAGDVVERVALLAEVRLDQPVDPVAGVVDGLGGAPGVVVDVPEVRRQRLGDQVVAGASQVGEQVGHRRDRPPQRSQLLAQRERVPAGATGRTALLQQGVLGAVHRLVERACGSELAVHHDVQQTVDEEPHTGGRVQLGVGVPAPDEQADVHR